MHTIDKAQSKSSAVAARRPFGFNIIGYVSGHGGLAISARNMARLLLEKGYRIATLDLDPGLGKQRHDSSLDQYAVESPSDLPYQINLICTSLSRMHEFVLQHHELLLRDDYLNAAVVYWELTVLPEVFAKALKLFDVLIAPSHYVRSSLECVLSDVRTIYATYPAYIPSVEPDRKRFGLPLDAVLLAYTFDPHSDPARKNPTRLIETFRRTFSAETNVGLVIKLNTPSADPSAFPAGVAATLRNLCAGDSRILVIAEPLTYPEVLSLYASCDIYVSLHRAEGLGLGLLEAMALGKPVIATAWSGNMTFMDYSNSCLVRYTLIPAEGMYPHYHHRQQATGAVWAEPDMGDAAAWMQRLVSSSDLRADIGAKAARAIAKYQLEAKDARFVDELRAIAQSNKFFPSRARAKAADMKALKMAVRKAFPVPPVPLSRVVHRTLDRYVVWRFRALKNRLSS